MNAFKVLALDGKARAGLLTTAHSVVNTPGMMIYTRRGAPMNLTPDMMDTLKPLVQAMQFSAMHFMEHPDPKILRKYGKGAHHFLALQDYTLFASTRDPTMYEFGGKPSTDKAAYVTIHSGGCWVTPAQYAEAIDALRPDLYVALSDEVTADAKRKRVVTSVDRSTQWLDAVLDEHQRRGLQGQCAVMAAVQGGALPQERARAAQAAAERPVDGFALCGFGTGESPAERGPLMEAALQHLPQEKLRMISGMVSLHLLREKLCMISGTGTPEEMLEAVEAGVDLFDCSYVAAAVAGGYALTLPIEPEGDAMATGDDPAADPRSGSDSMKMNLWSQVYRLDTRPLVEGCRCFSCRNHTRAYVHHLLQAHEMLADVLLEAHNTHCMLRFFDQMRTAISASNLAGFRQRFLSARPLAEAAVRSTQD